MVTEVADLMTATEDGEQLLQAAGLLRQRQRQRQRRGRRQRQRRLEGPGAGAALAGDVGGSGAIDGSVSGSAQEEQEEQEASMSGSVSGGVGGGLTIDYEVNGFDLPPSEPLHAAKAALLQLAADASPLTRRLEKALAAAGLNIETALSIVAVPGTEVEYMSDGSDGSGGISDGSDGSADSDEGTSGAQSTPAPPA